MIVLLKPVIVRALATLFALAPQSLLVSPVITAVPADVATRRTLTANAKKDWFLAEEAAMWIQLLIMKMMIALSAI